jgi:hypothetical protein
MIPFLLAMNGPKLMESLNAAAIQRRNVAEQIAKNREECPEDEVREFKCREPGGYEYYVDEINTIQEFCAAALAAGFLAEDDFDDAVDRLTAERGNEGEEKGDYIPDDRLLELLRTPYRPEPEAFWIRDTGDVSAVAVTGPWTPEIH